MEEMLTVVKGNTEYRVPAFKKKEYLDLGYSILDADGKVVVVGHPVTLKDHQQRISELEKEVARLKDEREKLAEENESLKQAYSQLMSDYNTLEASNHDGETKSTTKKGRASKGKNEADTEPVNGEADNAGM